MEKLHDAAKMIRSIRNYLMRQEAFDAQFDATIGAMTEAEREKWLNAVVEQKPGHLYGVPVVFTEGKAFD